MASTQKAVGITAVVVVSTVLVLLLCWFGYLVADSCFLPRVQTTGQIVSKTVTPEELKIGFNGTTPALMKTPAQGEWLACWTADQKKICGVKKDYYGDYVKFGEVGEYVRVEYSKTRYTGKILFNITFF